MESTMTETRMQSECAMWFWNTYPQYRRMLHCNMNNQTNQIAGNRSKAMGVVKGVTDLEFISFGAVFFIELKFGSGKLTDEQEDFRDKVLARGHRWVEIRSLEEFKKLIKYEISLGSSK